MKTRLFPLFLLLAAPCLAADPKPAAPAGPTAPAPAAQAPDDLTQYKTADALWNHLEALRKEPDVQPKSREEFLSIAKKWFGDQQAAASAFLKGYPEDPRRYAAKLLTLQAGLQLSRMSEDGPKTNSEDVLKELDAIVAAPDAPEDAKGEASFVQTMMKTEALEPGKTDGVKAFLDSAEAYLAQHGSHKLAPQMRQVELQVASQFDTPETAALLKQLSEGKDPALAKNAQQILAKQEKVKNLKTKPLDLKFTAVDGHEVDLAKMHGKVVLVDFWASWCGPCMAEAPNVVATYKKLHDRGFEIVGVSLDEKKDAMEGALTKQGMTWPQYFDGKGWQNAISTSFGIDSIPATFLVDKKGMVRETGVRGEALAPAIEKLLAE